MGEGEGEGGGDFNTILLQMKKYSSLNQMLTIFETIPLYSRQLKQYKFTYRKLKSEKNPKRTFTADGYIYSLRLHLN